MKDEHSRIQCDNLSEIALQTPKVVVGAEGDKLGKPLHTLEKR